MLLFILFGRPGLDTLLHSNTSHVIVYHGSLNYMFSKLSFKYISCYCLSNIISSHVFKNCNSNTSHVIVYPIGKVYANGRAEFKYISCYCLSECILSLTLTAAIQIHLMLLFIGGGINENRLLWIIQIHLMLLFIVLKSPPAG